MPNATEMSKIPHDNGEKRGSKRRRLNAASCSSSELKKAAPLGTSSSYQEDCTSSVALFRGITRLEDGGVVTHGITPLVFQALKKGEDDTGSKAIISIGTGIVHISQSDSWSCGYRSAQMVLSYLLPLLKQQMQPSSAVNGACEVIDLTMDTSPLKIDPKCSFNQAQSEVLATVDVPPLISTIQEGIEKSWTEGFDPKGAAHYKYRIRNSNARIGAVEVATLFRYWFLDATVVQFVKVTSSRRMLGPFVWTYFATNTLTNRNEENDGKSRPDFYHVGQARTAADILNLAQQRWEVQDSHQLHTNMQSSSGCPLYLQWEGHSVVVVGIERNIKEKKRNQQTVKKLKSSDSTSLPQDPDYNLLVFDPSNSCCTLKSALREYTHNHDGKYLKTILSIIRLPVDRLKHKDIQIIHCSPRLLSSMERLKWREDICAITAIGYQT